MIFVLLLLFIFGLFFGSFFNVIADRSVNRESFIKGRSKCDRCKKELSPLDLIPVLSYLFNRGKCRYCKGEITWWYPVSEILTGLLFSLSYILGEGFSIQMIFILAVFSFYIILFLTDAKYYLIPSSIIYPAILLAFIGLTLLYGYAYFELRQELLDNVLGKYLASAGYLDTQLSYLTKNYIYNIFSALGIMIFFWLLVVLTKGKGMGDGDIYLGLFVGLVSPFPLNVLGIFLAFVLGSIYSVPLLIAKKKTMKSAIPFGPFILLGSIVAMYFGSDLVGIFL